MTTATFSPRTFVPWQQIARACAAMLVAFLLAWIALPAHAAPPPAGTSISNQASATYSDGSGVSRTVTSNLVNTTVTQVYSLTLSAPGTQNATPGSVVYYPHTLTNTGNGTDTFNLTATTGTGGYTMAGVSIYADNGSGAPTGPAITTTGALASGATFKFIVAATLPATATNGQSNALVVTGTSVGGGASVNVPNTDTTTVTSSAVITLNKSISVATGTANSGPYTYTLEYRNTGNSDATAVAISDAIPAGMTYVAGSARWSVTGATALSDTGASSGSGANTLTSTYGSGTFTATIAKVTAGQSGFLTFAVTVNAGVAPGVINNTGSVTYNNGAIPNATATSNVVGFTVTQSAAVTLTGDTIPGTTTVPAGSTVSFTNVVKNTGNGSDTFNITFATTNTFPTGTTFQLYKSDGTTPLVDTNGDGVVDTGPLAANATYNVIVKATLPPNAGQSGGTGPYAIDKTATSILDNSKFQTATDTLTKVTPAKVDLINTSTTGPGVGAGPEGTAQFTILTNPGLTVTYTLVTKNTGSGPDSYDLAASTDSSFATTVLPTGWSLVFKADGGAGTCTTTGASITNTGTVTNGNAAVVCAVLTIPANESAGTTNVYFRSLSPTSSAKDILHDALTVNAVRSISLTPNGAGQTYPGGSYVYTHTLTNNGNVPEGGALSTMTPSLGNNGAGWTSTLYYDSNGNGTLDATDTLVTGALPNTITLAKGASITLFNKVIAPSGATAGNVNTTTITVNTANGTYTSAVPAATVATDNTTVIAGNLTLVKEQALDATCDGTADTAYSQANLNAKPGQCVMYQITVTNVGAADATGVVVSDATPAYTTISKVAATSAPNQVGASNPAVGAAGTIMVYIGTGATTSAGGTLAAGSSAVITFGVKITP